jgi:hypothetical protein
MPALIPRLLPPLDGGERSSSRRRSKGQPPRSSGSPLPRDGGSSSLTLTSTRPSSPSRRQRRPRGRSSAWLDLPTVLSSRSVPPSPFSSGHRRRSARLATAEKLRRRLDLHRHSDAGPSLPVSASSECGREGTGWLEHAAAGGKVGPRELSHPTFRRKTKVEGKPSAYLYACQDQVSCI